MCLLRAKVYFHTMIFRFACALWGYVLCNKCVTTDDHGDELGPITVKINFPFPQIFSFLGSLHLYQTCHLPSGRAQIRDIPQHWMRVLPLEIPRDHDPSLRFFKIGYLAEFVRPLPTDTITACGGKSGSMEETAAKWKYKLCRSTVAVYFPVFKWSSINLHWIL